MHENPSEAITGLRKCLFAIRGSDSAFGELEKR